MKYHHLDLDVKCPFCGKMNLVYKRPGLCGDVYRCAAELGGCERTIVHRRRKGGDRCGLTAVLNFGQFGPWSPCASAGAGRQPPPSAGMSHRPQPRRYA